MATKKNLQGKAACLAVLGTGSEVGKSIITTAICRWFANRGIRVAPFKAQNMSNNSGVTPEGLEMGRAQIVQAEACRLSPHVDMNPILLKPTTDVGAQVVLLGQARFNRSAQEYHLLKNELLSEACNALDRLRAQHELVVLEGAGSCAEVNLMSMDIVNLKMADYADAPVILVADIHRGGVFAQVVGTLACLPEEDRQRIAGFIINRFRGDLKLFEDGVQWLEDKTGKPVLGVVPAYEHIHIEAEDSVVIENPPRHNLLKPSGPTVVVVRLPHIANFTDIAPLQALEGLNVIYLERPQDLSGCAAVIIPGSKNTRFDLDWLLHSGWAGQIERLVHQQGHLLGICGGYQMLGGRVHDPTGLEGPAGSTPGLGLLPVETTLKAPKTTTLTEFQWGADQGAGYEIHMGQTIRTGGNRLFKVLKRNGQACNDEDGCLSSDGKVMGTYMHGLFDIPQITSRWLAHIGLEQIRVTDRHGRAARDQDYDLLADHFEAHVNTEALIQLFQQKVA